MFSQKEVLEIQRLFQSEFGLEASPEEARQYMAQFLDMLLVTYRNDEPPP